MFKKQGLVAKIQGKHCIVITREGLYKKVPHPGGEVRPGMEITYRELGLGPFLKPGLVAASFLILLLAFTLLQPAPVPQAVAYVSLDINPSLELSVDESLRVVAVKSFDQDGNVLARHAPSQGTNLYRALARLVDEAINLHYIKPGQNNLIVSCITAPAAGTNYVDAEKLQRVIEEVAGKPGLSSEVKVYSTRAEVRARAEKHGLSPGRFVIYEQVRKAGSGITIEEARQCSIRELLASSPITLTPGHQHRAGQTAGKASEPPSMLKDGPKADTTRNPGKPHDLLSGNHDQPAKDRGKKATVDQPGGKTVANPPPVSPRQPGGSDSQKGERKTDLAVNPQAGAGQKNNPASALPHKPGNPNNNSNLNPGAQAAPRDNNKTLAQLRQETGNSSGQEVKPGPGNDQLRECETGPRGKT